MLKLIYSQNSTGQTGSWTELNWVRTANRQLSMVI